MNSREWDLETCSPRTTGYDQLSAGLVASIIICGFLVLSLATVWLFWGDQEFQHASAFPQPVQWEDGANAEEEYELDEFHGSSGSDLESILLAVEDSVSHLSAIQGADEKGIRTLTGPVIRDPKPIPGGGVPANRWKITFANENIQQYKQQLDQRGIEIGVVSSQTEDVWRIGKLTSGVKVVHSSRGKERESVWFAHSKAKLRRWDRKISEDSGVETEAMLLVHFYPQALVSQIAELELAKLKNLGRKIEDVRKTVIRFHGPDERFSISVSHIEFR